eukprot:TRINITY_DN14180_c0_g1_i16.p1 TRINITY_DN14180_c0_g1~~TRINITY_DN14180_c0_g1_i16.p1  ORF type:complete len:124 (+),score=22.03 TRINITY_DN14180_c0_g1_i16:871-1242(+)
MNNSGKETVKSGTKRNYTSTSEESDTSFSDLRDSKSTKQENKRQYVTQTQQQDSMDIQEAIESMNKRLECLNQLECLDQLARKEDVSGIRSELKTLTTTFMEKIESLEGRVFKMEAQRDARGT